MKTKITEKEDYRNADSIGIVSLSLSPDKAFVRAVVFSLVFTRGKRKNKTFSF